MWTLNLGLSRLKREHSTKKSPAAWRGADATCSLETGSAPACQAGGCGREEIGMYVGGGKRAVSSPDEFFPDEL